MKSRFRLDLLLFVSVSLLLLSFGGALLAEGVVAENYLLAGLGGILSWGGLYVSVAGRGMWPRRALRLLTGGLVAWGIVTFIQENWAIQNFLEHALLMGAPMVLAMRWSEGGKEAAVQLALFLSAATFLGHGVYALGYGRDSTNFIEMVTALTGLDERGADIFLLAAGVLDVAAAVTVVMGRWFRIALWYMVIWGLVTALARLFFYISPTDFWGTFAIGLAACGYRLVHGLAPLWILLLGRKEKPQ